MLNHQLFEYLMLYSKFDKDSLIFYCGATVLFAAMFFFLFCQQKIYRQRLG